MDVMLPRPYGIVGLIGDMIRDGELPPLGEAVAVVRSGDLGGMCNLLKDEGPARPHRILSMTDAVVRKRPGLTWAFIAEKVERLGGELKIIDANLPADPRLLGPYT
jgi:hypothetical protein